MLLVKIKLRYRSGRLSTLCLEKVLYLSRLCHSDRDVCGAIRVTRLAGKLSERVCGLLSGSPARAVNLPANLSSQNVAPKQGSCSNPLPKNFALLKRCFTWAKKRRLRARRFWGKLPPKRRLGSFPLRASRPKNALFAVNCQLSTVNC